MMLQHNTPAGVLVNQHGDILYLHGRTGVYLELASGEAGLNIPKMAREGLRDELGTDLYKAVVHKEPVFHPGLRVNTNGDFTIVNMVVRSVATGPETASEPKLFLVTFEEIMTCDGNQTEKVITNSAREDPINSTTVDDARILELKRELEIKEERLKAYNEELETSKEEL